MLGFAEIFAPPAACDTIDYKRTTKDVSKNLITIIKFILYRASHRFSASDR